LKQTPHVRYLVLGKYQFFGGKNLKNTQENQKQYQTQIWAHLNRPVSQAKKENQ